MKILITTVKLGMGHFKASESLSKQLKTQYPDAEIVVLDFLHYVFPDYSKKIYDTYTQFVKKGKKLYNYLYQKSESSSIHCQAFIPPHFVHKMEKCIFEQMPDVIISTCSLCSQVVSLAKEKTYINTPFITCITDFSSHPSWRNPHTDFYLVGSIAIKEKLIQDGATENKIFVNGIPVQDEFQPAKSSEATLGQYQTKKLLIMGGGLGLIPSGESFFDFLNHHAYIKTTVIVGNNKKLLRKLREAYQNIYIIGYTKHVAFYMQQADLVLTKPGGLTLSEAIHCEVPLLLFKPELNQEVKNCEFILQKNIGEIFSPVHTEQIEQFIFDDTRLLQMKKNMQLLKSEIDREPLYQFLSAACYDVFTPLYSHGK